MINFNSMTEAEKFTFAKEFMLRYRVVKNLKPNITESVILSAVASKFYSGDTVGLDECIKFIEEKCGAGVPLDDTAPLDRKKDDYIKSLNGDVKDKLDAFNQKSKEKSDKEAELTAEASKRNGLEENLAAAQNKLWWQENKTAILVLGLVAVGFIAVVGLGGVGGAINALTGFISNLAFTQALTLVALGFAGVKVYGYFKDKIKARSKAKTDALKKVADSAKSDLDKSKEKVKTLQSEIATATVDVQNAGNEHNKALNQKNAEMAHLSSFRSSTEFDVKLNICVNQIKVDFEDAKTRMTRAGAPSGDILSLEDWRNHFVGALYFGASKGTISTETDIDNIYNQAKAKFNDIEDPLMLDKEYNKANVNLGTDSRTNQTLDELYVMI